MERGGNNRRRNLSRPCTFVGKYPAQNAHFGFYGVFKRAEQFNDIPKMVKHEICTPKSRTWGGVRDIM